MFVIPVLWRPRQGHHERKASLSYTASLWISVGYTARLLKNPKQTKIHPDTSSCPRVGTHSPAGEGQGCSQCPHSVGRIVRLWGLTAALETSVPRLWTCTLANYLVISESTYYTHIRECPVELPMSTTGDQMAPWSACAIL